MTTSTSRSLAVLVLAGCSSAVPPAAPDASPPAPQPVTYTIQSQFDVSTNLPGEVGHVLATLFDATDDPDDPTRFLIDRMIDRMEDGSMKTAMMRAAPFLGAYLNARVLAVAPDLVRRLVTVGRELGVAAHSMGTLDTLQISADGRAATHTIQGLRYELDGSSVQLPFADYGMQPVAAPAITVIEGGGAIAVARHRLALPYGALIRLTLDHAIVPRVDPGAVDLLGLLHDAVDCGAIGKLVAEALGFGEPAVYTTACNAALTLAATTVYGEIARLDDDVLELDVAGLARTVDGDHDGAADQIVDGVWSGTLSHAGTPGPLGEATWHGSRSPY